MSDEIHINDSKALLTQQVVYMVDRQNGTQSAGEPVSVDIVTLRLRDTVGACFFFVNFNR